MLNTRDLIPVLPPQPGVCRVCRGWSSTYPTCFQCAQAESVVGTDTMPIVLPLTLAVHDSPLAHALWRYKNADGVPQSEATELLKALLGEYLPLHLPCLARTAELDRFDIITWVPSANRPSANHPLNQLLRSDAVLGNAVTDVIDVDPESENNHVLGQARHFVNRDLDGAAVLIVDDTWTSGSSVFGCTRALRQAGASSVLAVILGRAFRPDYRAGWRYSLHASALGFDVHFCALCDSRSGAVADLLGGEEAL